MTLGAEPKKMAALAVLLLGAAYSMYVNVFADAPGGPAQSAAPAPARVSQAPAAAAQRTVPSIERDRRALSQEWVPTLKPKRPEDVADPMTVDPTLRLDLLAKLAAVSLSGGNRSLFEFSQAPLPKVPEPKIIPKDVAAAKAAELAQAAQTPAAPAEPAKPTAPPIPLKFYGFVSGGGPRRAFFLNGEDILVATEGQTLQSRYKIIRISLSTAVVEDTQFKSQQTIRLEEPPAGGA
ncbi:MAG: hypothetical protein JJE04_27020 [Acidobacteriia bacterium]|nr:hypothetical protein [Terriglobia bacterium]